MEEDFEGTETRLNQTSTKLDEASKAADESERLTSQLLNASRIADQCSAGVSLIVPPPPNDAWASRVLGTVFGD